MSIRKKWRKSMIDKTIIKPYEELDLKIYAYALPEVPNHNGYIKVGDTTRDTEQRIKEQVGTAGLNPDILFTKKAQKSDGSWFHDKQLHRYFELNGIERKDFNGIADEWFYFNGTPERAEELTDKFIRNDYEEVQANGGIDYVLRKEQQRAIEDTLTYIKNGEQPPEFLWNAKPRFGKTLTTYDLCRQLYAQKVLIVTNRPAIANSWLDDFEKFVAWQEKSMKFVSETDSLKGKALTRKEFLDFAFSSEKDTSQITFISLQDLKGSKFAGGTYEKLDWVGELEWDILVIDEAHEGVDTAKTDRAFDKIKRKFTLHLSGTPFKQLANDKFNENQIYNWSYIDEQQAKEKWDYATGSNPYENLPTLNLFTYQMSKMIEEKLTQGLKLDDNNNVDYAFDLNEFFSTDDKGKFKYEDSVIKFLDNLSAGKFPFSEGKHRSELNHTFWLLPRVASAKALEALLKNHPVFKDYRTVLAAGDGVSNTTDETIKLEAQDTKMSEKSLDRVRKAIKENEKTITLSVGQLTTGVTIPEWTAVLMLNNIKSPSLYFQAAFRAQNPYEYKGEDGKLYRKENAYIFDFAPERTLSLFDEFANNLTIGRTRTTDERKTKIKKLLNFFPVIGEDEEGEMHELDAEEVLTIPTHIRAIEVVKRGFMSNLLFDNVSGIFSGTSPFKEILDKIKPEKNKKLADRREITVTKPMLDDEGNISIPKQIVINQANDLFGDAIYTVQEKLVIPNISQVSEITKQITKTVAPSFNNVKESFGLNKTQTDSVQKDFETKISKSVEKEFETYQENVQEVTKSHEKQIQQVQEAHEKQLEVAKKLGDHTKVTEFQQEFEQKKAEIKKSFTEKKVELDVSLNQNINKAVKDTAENVVKKEIEKKENDKKRTTEDDVRDHLRGFARTIPSFLMAYGNNETTIDNFDENIDEDTFFDLTSISLDEFRKLRDGFTYIENGKEKNVPGLFNKVVFNDSIKEFFNIKNKLANYFDDSLEEDIFDYIPPQKTNQIFTPKAVVKRMVDDLEKENPDIFKNPYFKFADLYVKSGLYITEIVKRLSVGLKETIPNKDKRLKHILENMVYAAAPSNIIYHIARNYIFSNFNGISDKHIIETDLTKHTEDGKFDEVIKEGFGDENLKFDVIIGNPPYQEETKNTSDNPIYHLFMDEAYKLSDKVLFITPARFLFNAGKTPKSWNKKMLNDKHLRVEFYEQDSSKVFPHTSITGGLAITYRDRNQEFGAIEVFTVYPELNMILNKVENYEGFESFSDIVYSAFSYKLMPELYADYPEIETMTKINKKGETVPLISNGHKFDLATNILESLDFVVTEEKSDGLSDEVQLFGRIGTERSYRYIKRKYIRDNGNLDYFKVFVPKANGASGQIVPDSASRIISMPEIGAKGVAHTNSFISIGKFDSEFEAQAALKYVKSKFARVLLGILKITQDNQVATWSKVPNQDFSPESDIDWNKSIPEIDQQLYKKYGLDETEITFIENHICYLEN